MGQILTPVKGGGDYGDVIVVLDGVTVNALGEQISSPIPMHRRTNMALWYKVTSLTGVPVVRFFVDMSPDLDEDNFIVPAGVSDLETALTDLNGITLQYVGSEASARVTVADYNGITIQYVGDGPTGTVEVTENALNLYVGGSLVQSYDLTVVANDTIAEIVALIDALSEWTCAKHANMAGTELSKHLKIIAQTDCKTGAISLAMDRCIFAEAPNDTPDTNFGPAGKMFLRLPTVDTITEIVSVIDGLTYWTCTKHADMTGNELSKFMKLLSATACKSGTVTLAIELPHLKSISVPPMRYMRVGVQGVSSNPADTVVTAKLFVQ